MATPHLVDAFRFLDLPNEIQVIIAQYSLVAQQRILPLPIECNSKRDNDLSPSMLRGSKHLHCLCAPILYGQNEFEFTPKHRVKDYITVQRFRNLIGKRNADLIRKVLLKTDYDTRGTKLRNVELLEVDRFVIHTFPRFKADCYFSVDTRGCHVVRAFPNLQYLVLKYIQPPLFLPRVIKYGRWRASFKCLSICYGMGEIERLNRTFSGEMLREPTAELLEEIERDLKHQGLASTPT